MGRSIHTIKKNTEDQKMSLVTSRKVDLKVNTEKTVCLSLEYTAGHCHNINIGKSFESVE